MIGLTRRTGELCRLDPDHIERMEGGFDTVVVTTDGSHYCVRETVDQIIGRIVEDRAGAIAACYVLDRGEDADPLGLGRRDVPPEAHGPAPVLPIRLA
ncbi:MAG: flagellar FlbD family protein [Actinomycetota bacterium]|nr:flagellar FlbD family protein [Actinomycetota bacterium]